MDVNGSQHGRSESKQYPANPWILVYLAMPAIGITQS